MQRLALLVDLVWWSNDPNNPLDWGLTGALFKSAGRQPRRSTPEPTLMVQAIHGPRQVAHGRQS